MTGSGAAVARSFTNAYDDVAGTITATDQDSNTFTVTTDAVGRVATVSRLIAHPEIDPLAFTEITASYIYDDYAAQDSALAPVGCSMAPCFIVVLQAAAGVAAVPY